MATAPLGADSAHVIHPNRFPPAAAARVASQMLDRFNRDELGNAIEVLVTLLDLWDGDPDLEGEWSEDEISTTPSWVSLKDGPGCQIADAGGQCDEDDLNTALGWVHGHDNGPGCKLSDDDTECSEI